MKHFSLIILFFFAVLFCCNFTSANEYATPVNADVINTYDTMNNIRNSDRNKAYQSRVKYRNKSEQKTSDNKEQKKQKLHKHYDNAKQTPAWWRQRGSYFGFGTQFD